MYETTKVRPKNPIAFYFGKVKDLELGPAHFNYLSQEAIQVYAQEVRPMYEILYDRIVTSRISPFIKQEFEQWFISNKDSIGQPKTPIINRELESMLRRFDLL